MLVGVLFGVLHKSGPRNWQFAAWAGAVGVLYGLAYTSTYDLSVPVLAHSCGNLGAAWFWLRARDTQDRQDLLETDSKH